jgi:AAA15 family ATPase/GTPase
LQPSIGCNLFNILSSLPDLKRELIDILGGYGLKLAFDNADQQIKFWKELTSGEVFIVPFNSIADTLQRMIFYKTAIASNQHSIITFEEPEAHAYPPYISKITADILYSESNQFFITTHSPYVVSDFIESNLSELAVFIVDYQKEETVVKRLSDEEIEKVHEFGVDLFFNTEMFLN